ncbi:MAG: DUF3105 domain-containing protein [Nitriliruptor sp.]|uniref:DUF3105 domain-containing protein n=1 Tax=Nitriliruptor sp. TaxID=2448056 RepID=UPI0034A0148F
MSGLPPHRHGGTPSSPPDRGRTLRLFAVAALGLLVAGFAAGALFGRVDPERAARVVVAEFTTTADGPADAPGPDPDLPVTGPQRGDPICGRVDDPLSPEQQVETLAAGVVLIHHPPDLAGDQFEVLAALAERDRVAVAPHASLPDGVTVVATSWRQRMPLESVDRDLLDAFVTGHADRAPAVAHCP